MVRRTHLTPFLLALALALGPASALGQETTSKKTPPPPSKTGLNPFIEAQAKARSKALKQQKAKAIPDAQKVDINGATKAELKKLPGVTDALADRIIAGRPYRTKIHLVNRDIMSFGLYTSLKGRIVARQPGVKPPPPKPAKP